MPEKISLIPRDYKGEKAGLETVVSKAGVLVIVLIIISLAVYVGLLFYNKSLNSQLKELQNQIIETNKQRDEEFEKEIISLEKVLRNLKIILRDHLYWSNLFSKLEDFTVPQVSFSEFDGRVEEDSISSAFNGKTAGYTYLAKQMVSLSQEKTISEVNLSGVNLSTEGGIEFTLNIIFLKDILFKK